MTDWSTYNQSEMIAISGIRLSESEGRVLIDAPGHALSFREKDIGISLFSLSASFGWSPYLYSPRENSILHNWEGDVFDFWTNSEETFTEMKRILHEFELSETGQNGEQDGETDG